MSVRQAAAALLADLPRRRSLLSRAAKPLLAGVAAVAVTASLAVGAMWWNLPDADETRLIARSAHIHVSKRTDRSTESGKPAMRLELVGNRFDYSLNTSLENVSQDFVHAVIASEDRHFHRSGSFRIGQMLVMFAEAAVNCATVRLGQGATACRGNSTLPQQLARNLLLGEHRGPFRKVVELVWAIKMELGLRKDEILEFYVNRAYFGNGNYGVEMASRYNFGKSASTLTRTEAVYLAAALKRPGWNWRGNRSGALQRGRLILELMKREGYASANDALPDNFAPRRGQRRVTKPYLGHLWQWVRGEVEDTMRRLPDGNYKVMTTLNAEAEIYAEVELEREVQRWQRKGIPVSQGATVLMRPNGSILAMVGGVGDDVRGRGTNRSKRTEGLMPRPPASAFKPFVYLDALEQGLEPESLIDAKPVDIPDASGAGSYRPRNLLGERYGKVPMREGLVHSINTAAVRLLQQNGYDSLFDTLGRLGVRTEYLRRELGLALGSSGVPLVELVGAYATIANGGHSVAPWAVVAVTTDRGRFIWPRPMPGTNEAAFAEDDINALDDMLRETVARGTAKEAAASHLLRDRIIAGKTGTGDDFVDAWFVGYTGDLVMGVWFGNDRPLTMTGLYGGTGPARTFRAILVRLVKHTDLVSSGRRRA